MKRNRFGVRFSFRDTGHGHFAVNRFRLPVRRAGAGEPGRPLPQHL